MSTADKADGFYYDLVAKEDFEQLIGGVDRDHFRTWENENVKIEANPDEPDNHYSFTLQPLLFDPDQRDYVEGQFEGVVINCVGGHYSENYDAELRLTLGHEKIKRVRLAIGGANVIGGSIACFDENNNEIERLKTTSFAWYDLKVPLLSSQSIARVSLFNKVGFGGPFVDSLEMWRAAPLPKTVT